MDWKEVMKAFNAFAGFGFVLVVIVVAISIWAIGAVGTALYEPVNDPCNDSNIRACLQTEVPLILTGVAP
jgi:hypothetical protein